MRSWRAARGEQIRGIPTGSEVVGTGDYQGRPQWIYRNERQGTWYRITRMSDSSHLIEEFTAAEVEAMGLCGQCND